MSVGEATLNDTNLLSMLNQMVKKLGNPPGEPVVKPGPQSVPPDAPADSLVLHLSARGATRGTSYRMFPAENWIVLGKQEWAGLLPTGEAKVHDSWTIEKDLAAKLLIKFYPQTVEITAGVERGRIDKQLLTVTATSIRDGIVHARIDGTLHMKHGSVAHNEDSFVDAVLTGFVEYDPVSRTVQRLRLVTKKATYGSEEFLAALRSVPAAANQ